MFVKWAIRGRTVGSLVEGAEQESRIYSEFFEATPYELFALLAQTNPCNPHQTGYKKVFNYSAICKYLLNPL